MVFVADRSRTIVGEVQAEIHREIKPVERGRFPGGAELCESSGGKGIAFEICLIVEKLRFGVETLRCHTVCVAVVVNRTVFVLEISVFVKHVVSFHILEIDRIDWSHKLGGVPDIGNL